MEQQTVYVSFDEKEVNPDWSFKNVRSVEQWTHGYHRYPAKFLPNLVKKLIEEYTKEDDLVADLFAGCGTTLVEARVHGRRSVGVDINPVAELITKAKICPIWPEKLEEYYDSFVMVIEDFREEDFLVIPVHKRLDYWFKKEQKAQIAYLYKKILMLDDEEIKTFMLVSLSHILKNCSRWLQTSTKPQVDPNKVIPDPFIIFQSHTRQMMKKNKEYYEYLDDKKYLDVSCEIKLGDARKTDIPSNSVEAIITSPPYVTSYEYADIHQLTAYWFEYLTDLVGFRKNFIGTFFSYNVETNFSSAIGQKIIDDLLLKDKRTAKEVANYFRDMDKVAKEMQRILKEEGYACLVIGNTTLRNVKIRSAEVLTDILVSNGFEMVEIIKRSIPNKLIPTIRDKDSGRFTKLNSINSKLVYPEEYILIAKNSKYGNS